MRFKCNKELPCIGCAECCRFREKINLDEDEEKIKIALFQKTGTIYLYPFSRYTINITKDEKEILEKKARKKNLIIRILPKKVFLTKDSILIYDYFIDHDVCPFLTEENKCSIYESRPKICQDFPEMKYSNNVFEEFQKEYDKKVIKEDYDSCLKIVKEKLNIE